MKVNPDLFIHPSDKTALNQLEAIPAFPELVKKIMSIGMESYQYGTNMASNIRLSKNQLPDIYKHLPPICEKLGISEPELYLQMNPIPNAYTFGDTRIFITLTSGLLESMTDEELDAVIAHECGHILCRHVLYHTVANIIRSGAESLGLLGKMAIPIQFALFYWYRMSELSCDRAAALVTSPDIVSSTMARLAGGPKSITQNINFEEWAKQADEYEKIRQNGMWNKTLQTLAVMSNDHPFSAVRVREIRNWSQTDIYKKLKNCIQNGTDMEADESQMPNYCPYCGTPITGDWFFCRNCGTKIRK